MTTEKVLKNILWRPEQAFKPDQLEETFTQSLLSFIVLALLSSAIMTADRLPKLHILAKYPQLLNAPHLIALASYGLVFLAICIDVWVIGLLVKWIDREVSAKSLLAGILWISVVAWPLGWVLHSLLFRWSGFVIVPYRLWLTTICVRSTTGLSTEGSFAVYLISLVVIGVAAVMVAILISQIIFRNMGPP